MKIYPVTDLLSKKQDIAILKTIVEGLSFNKSSKHRFTDQSTEADAYLFFSSCIELNDLPVLIKQHPFIKKFPSKCFLICDKDIHYPVLPGLYSSLPKRPFYNWFYRTCFYLNATNPSIAGLKNENIQPKYLASFQGGLSSRLRQKLQQINFDTNEIRINFVKPQWEDFIAGTGFKNNDSIYLKEYAKLIFDSKFILCPRGNGISSYRLFETLEAGRIPVIISDKYVAPKTVKDWDKFTIQVPEKEIHQLNIILKSKEKDWDIMSKKALYAHQNHFSPENRLQFIGDAIQDIIRTNPLRRRWHYTAYWIWVDFNWFLSEIFRKIKLEVGRRMKK